MPDSVRIKEIHAMLGAGEWAQDTIGVPTTSIPVNTWWYLERVAQALGISFYPDRTIRSIKQKGYVPPGTPIPAGWKLGQFDIHNGNNPNQQGTTNVNDPLPRLGIAYRERCNRLVVDPANPGEYKAEPGRYVLCENLAQMWDAIMNDMDGALDMGDGCATIVQTQDGETCYYNGIADLLIDIAYTLNAISAQTSQGLISSFVIQKTTQEILRAFGQPVEPQSITIAYGNTEYVIPYPGLAPDAPSVIEQVGWILTNIGILVGGNISGN